MPGSTIKNRSPFFTCLKYVQHPTLMRPPLRDDFKPYQLHDQNERTPIGGKIVFQRWHDSKTNRDLMKIEYVYQSAEQLRNADALTLQAPAQRVTLELSGCPIDTNGFCPMDKFDSVLNEAVK